MCNLYRMTKPVSEVAAWFDAVAAADGANFAEEVYPGYPGLVVHGPLQATLMAALALEAAPGARLVRFAFRGKRPCFDGRALTVLAKRDGTTLALETRDDTGATCMQADAVVSLAGA